MTDTSATLAQAPESPQRLVDMVFRLREYGIIVVLVRSTRPAGCSR